MIWRKLMSGFFCGWILVAGCSRSVEPSNPKIQGTGDPNLGKETAKDPKGIDASKSKPKFQ